jgi:uncharacterized protein with ParB-like and HNH nuclease domain
MKINCIDKEILGLLQSGFYKIPRFQRPYSWDKDNIEEFWNDSVVESSKDYFIGSFVVFKTTNNIYGIVDGQQRLTTVTVILCCIRDTFLEEGHKHLAEGVNNLIEKTDLRNEKQFILQTESSYPYFQEYIQKFGDPEIQMELRDEEKNLKDAYDLIYKKIKTQIKVYNSDRQLTDEQKKEKKQKLLESIRDKILSLKFIYVELDDEDDAYLVFETLNTRGKDLRPSDLIKNHFTKYQKNLNQNVDITKDKWNILKSNIESSPGNINLDEFFHHVWLSKHEFTTQKNLFSKFRKIVTKSNSRTVLDEFLFDSKVYRYINEPSFKNWDNQHLEIKRSLEALILFKTTVQMPMVLSVLRDFESNKLSLKHTNEILQAIEHFHFIFTAITAQRTSGAIGSMYSKYSRELYKAKNGEKIVVIRELRDKLFEKLPSYEEFKVAFSEVIYTNKYTKDRKLVRYILNKNHRYLSHKDGISINYGLMTIEHILAQNSPLAIAYDDNIVGQIGNLMLVNETLNQKLENKHFSEKKKIYLNSKLYLDDFIKDNTDWTKDIIEARTAYYADLSYSKVFKIK